MGSNSTIEWTNHTFNPWRGCDKVSAGCDNCYAETMSHRNPKVLGEWGPDGTRVIAAEAYWALPLKWNRKAQEAGVRARVFCLSLGDVWEDRPELLAPRERLLNLSHRCNWLDWLFLTKRPENIPALLALAKHDTFPHEDWWALVKRQPRPNWWLGVSAEDQETFDLRWPLLAAVPAVVRFVSAEPLLGPIDARSYLNPIWECTHCGRFGYRDEFPTERGLLACYHCRTATLRRRSLPNWLIVGGESGPHARPMHPQWARSLRNQCTQAGVAFFFKQWGEHIPDSQWTPANGFGTHRYVENPDCGHSELCHRIGKHRAGRLLDGRTWDQLPGEPLR